jgi:RNA polymerase sigma-70 factor (ECF subfamily)
VVDPALASGLVTPVPEPSPVAAPVFRRAATQRRSAPRPERADLPGLVAAARDGDPEALDALVRATYADAYTLAYRLTGNADDARDVVQEAYLRAHRGLPRFRGDAQFTTWLYRITANCASTAVRKRRRTHTEPLPDDAPVVDRRPDFDPEGRATSAEDRTMVAAALTTLPTRLRQVIVLRDIYDLPHRAIAQELGISEAAAKVRLHRARRRLKDALEADADVDAGTRTGRHARAH